MYFQYQWPTWCHHCSASQYSRLRVGHKAHTTHTMNIHLSPFLLEPGIVAFVA